ncbi:unnamed protein product [Boreogadus saida]
MGILECAVALSHCSSPRCGCQQRPAREQEIGGAGRLLDPPAKTDGCSSLGITDNQRTRGVMMEGEARRMQCPPPAAAVLMLLSLMLGRDLFLFLFLTLDPR